MRPRAFLEPFVSRGTGHLPFTTKRGQARNGQDPVSCSPRVSSSTIYSREQSTNFVVEFIYLLFLFFFFSKKARKTSHLRRIALGDTEFNRTHRCFEVAEVRDVGLSSVYTFSTSSREKNYQPFEGKIGLRFHFVLIFIDFLFSFYYLRYEFDFALQRVNQCSSLLYHVRCNFESQMNLFFFFF